MRYCIVVIAAVLAAVMSTGATAAEGCYLRAGIGFERLAKTEFRDVNCAIDSPVPLYGCGLGNDGTPMRSVGEFSTATGFEVGIGGTVTPAVRMEALLEFRPRLAFSGLANYPDAGPSQTVSVDASAMSGMVAAYADLPALGLPRLGPLDPFVGVGLGVARIRTSETQMMFPVTTTHVPGGHRTGVAWMVTAGVATALDKSTTLELAWRYSDLGTVETGTGGGQVVWRDGRREPFPINQAATEARLRSHGLRLSVRYLF